MKDLFDNQIPLMKPWLGVEECEAMKETILSGWISQGPKVKEFEEMIASFIGAKYAIATNSCTSAIHLSLITNGIQKGDEVLLPDFTCMADANAIIMAGATPVFVDIDEKTLNMDPLLVENYINENTRAILLVDQIGLPADIDPFIEIAKKHNLVLIDDAATALGAKYKGSYLGSFGVPTTFSFHPRKMITTGEGGMLLTNDKNMADSSRVLRSAGASVSDLDRHKSKGEILQKYKTNGFNYRMTDIQATIGIIQMNKLALIKKARLEQARYYIRALKEMEELECPYVPPYAEHVFSSFILKIRKGFDIMPNEIINKMSARNISCRFGIQPLHQEPYFASWNLSDDCFPNTIDIAKRSFFIPIYPGLSFEKIDYIIMSLKEIFTKRDSIL